MDLDPDEAREGINQAYQTLTNEFSKMDCVFDPDLDYIVHPKIGKPLDILHASVTAAKASPLVELEEVIKVDIMGAVLLRKTDEDSLEAPSAFQMGFDFFMEKKEGLQSKYIFKILALVHCRETPHFGPNAGMKNDATHMLELSSGFLPGKNNGFVISDINHRSAFSGFNRDGMTLKDLGLETP